MVILCDLFIFITLLCLMMYLSLAEDLDDDLKRKEKTSEYYEENESPFISALIKITSNKLSDSQRLDRLARGAEYVDKFDALESGYSDLINPESIKDFAKDPSLNLITTYGEDRVKEENIKRNLFKSVKDQIYFADDVERKRFINNSTIPKTSVLDFLKSLFFTH